MRLGIQRLAPHASRLRVAKQMNHPFKCQFSTSNSEQKYYSKDHIWVTIDDPADEGGQGPDQLWNGTIGLTKQFGFTYGTIQSTSSTFQVEADQDVVVKQGEPMVQVVYNREVPTNPLDLTPSKMLPLTMPFDANITKIRDTINLTEDGWMLQVRFNQHVKEQIPTTFLTAQQYQEGDKKGKGLHALLIGAVVCGVLGVFFFLPTHDKREEDETAAQREHRKRKKAKRLARKRRKAQQIEDDEPT